MRSKTDRNPGPAKARSSTNKQHIGVKQAAKKRRQKWSRDRSERVRDALNRDADLLYSALENPPMVPPTTLQMDSIVPLVESMQGLGR